MTSWKRAIADALGGLFGVELVRRADIHNGDMHVVARGDLGTQFEKEHLRRFLRHFQVDCVFDVGANEGQYAEGLRALGYDGLIVSFEPIPEAAELLRRKAASDPRWLIEELALHDSDGVLDFHVMARPQFSSLKRPSHAETGLFEQMNAVARTVTVATARLDRVYDRYRASLGFSRPFLKMDTQGNDLSVALGAGDRLGAFIGLQSELAIKRLYEDQADYRQSIDFYRAAGFELSAFVPNNAGHFPDLIEIDCIMYRPDGEPDRLPVDVGARKALTDSLPIQAESAADVIRNMRDSDRY